MNCNDVQEKIEVYLDVELTLSDRRDLEKHLRDCKQCQLILDDIQLLNELVQKTNYVKAPFSLQRKIKKDLKGTTGEVDATYNRFQLFGFATSSAVLASILVWAVMTFMVGASVQVQLVNELTEAHVRSLMVDHIADIITSDKHTVKPWFSGKLDFSPPVKDFKNQGFQLIGGRLDYLRVDPVHQQPAAVLIYKRRSHYINLFVYRDDQVSFRSSLNDRQNQSYNLINWHKQGLDYWLVSDLNIAELEQFAQLLDD